MKYILMIVMFFSVSVFAADAKPVKPISVMYSISPDVMFENAHVSDIGRNKIQDIESSARQTKDYTIFINVTNSNEVLAAKQVAVLKFELLTYGIPDNQIMIQSQQSKSNMIFVQILGVR